MSTRLTWLTPAQAATLMRWNIGYAHQATFGDGGELTVLPELSRMAAGAELLRAALWTLSSGGVTPVYITRLLNAMRPPMEVLHRGAIDESPPYALDPDEPMPSPDEVLRDLLDDLAMLGDVAELGRGYWLPAPGRLVRLPSTGRMLLVGGPPSRALQEDFRAILTPAGLLRIFSVMPASHPFGAQSFDNWLGRPAEPLADWTARVLRDTPMVPFESATVRFEGYTPAAAAPETPQFLRWRDVDTRLPGGRHLVRSRTLFGYTYVLADVDGGRVTAIGELGPDAGATRRLMYGLDARAERPVIIRSRRITATIELELRSALPPPELRVLAALAECRTPPGRHWPQTWRLDASYLADMWPALVDLGVSIQDASGIVGERTAPARPRS